MRDVSKAFGLAASLIVAGAVLLATTIADAKTDYDSPYGFDRTWNAALRLVRVDMGFKVTEKDDANGYLLFDYKSSEGSSKLTNGSMEFVRTKDPDAPIKVVVQLTQMPRYHEQLMVDALVKKMRAEYGDPPPRRAKAPSIPDAGPDAEAN